MGNAGKTGQRKQDRERRISFGDGLLVRRSQWIVVEEGNRLINFDYDGIFEEILDQLGTDAAAAVYYPSAAG